MALPPAISDPIGTAPPWMRQKPMQAGTMPATGDPYMPVGGTAPPSNNTMMGAGSGGAPTDMGGMFGSGGGSLGNPPTGGNAPIPMPKPGQAPPMVASTQAYSAAPAPAENPNSPQALYRAALAQAAQETQAGNANQAAFNSGNGGSPPPAAGAPAPAAPAAAVNPAARGPVPGTDPVSGTAGIDIGSQEAWKGGPSVDRTRVGANGLPEVSTDFSGDAQRGADAAYKGATQFLDKDFGNDTAALESKLVNQGFQPGSQAYDNEMEKLRRSQGATRENAAFAAQGVGFDQSGQMLARALQTRAQMRGERTDDADRTFNQSLGVAGLGLNARGQDTALQGAKEGAAASIVNAGTAAGASNYNADVSGGVAMRRLGLDQNNSDVNNLIAMINASRGGVNMPNFGAPAPLDVGGANSIASGNANNAAARTAANNGILAQLGGSLIGSAIR